MQRKSFYLAALVALLALVVLGAVPLWLVAHVPTQDGAQHVESVTALLALPHSALLQRFYLPNWGPQPNWLTQMAFAGLVQVVSPVVAEKIVLTGYGVLLPVAFRSALPATPRGRWAALGIFPFVYGYPFHMGFWNFSYSLVLFFAVLGVWYRARGRLVLGNGLAFCGLTALLFAAHAVSISSAFAAITAVLVFRAAVSVRRAGRNRARRALVLRGYARRAASTCLFALPSAALLAVFFLRQPEPYAYRPPLLVYVKHFVSLYGLVSFDRRELLVTGAVSVAIVLSVVAALRRRRPLVARPADGWLAAAALSAALYFARPDAAADGAQISDRLNLYPFFAALLWMGWSTVSLRRVKALAAVLLVLSLAGTALRLVKYRQIEAYLDEIFSAVPHVPEQSVVLPLTFSPFGPRADDRIDGRKLLSYRVEVFRHVAGYIATERHGVDLDNSQARTTHTPLRWREEMDPFVALQTRGFGMETEPPCVELWPYPALGGRIDRVLVVGDTSPARKDECGSAVLRELGQSWDRVFVSAPRGFVQVFAPRPRAAP